MAKRTVVIEVDGDEADVTRVLRAVRATLAELGVGSARARSAKPAHDGEKDWKAIAQAALLAIKTGENLASLRARFGLSLDDEALPDSGQESETTLSDDRDPERPLDAAVLERLARLTEQSGDHLPVRLFDGDSGTVGLRDRGGACVADMLSGSSGRKGHYIPFDRYVREACNLTPRLVAELRRLRSRA